VNSTCNAIPNITKQTSCDGCNYTAVTLDLPVRSEVRTLTMRHDHCTDPITPAMTLFEATKLSTKSATFTKNDCVTGTGSTVTHSSTKTATAYSTVSQLDADTKAQSVADSMAQSDANSNGQTYANAIGSCS
jgi:Family of unknown function (DUF5977)